MLVQFGKFISGVTLILLEISHQDGIYLGGCGRVGTLAAVTISQLLYLAINLSNGVPSDHDVPVVVEQGKHRQNPLQPDGHVVVVVVILVFVGHIAPEVAAQ